MAVNAAVNAGRKGGVTGALRFIIPFVTAAAVTYAATAGDYVAETAVAAGFEFGTVMAGVLLAMTSSSWEGYDPEDPVGLGVSYVIFASYPLMTTLGAYVTGEHWVDAPATNRGTALGYPVLAAYGQSILLTGTGAIAATTGGAASADWPSWLILADLITKPILVTVLYNKVKKPQPVNSDGRLLIQPFVARAARSDGSAVPLYGVSVSF